MAPSYRPMILSSRLWLSALALCFYVLEVDAKIRYHHTSPTVCYDQNHNKIPCPKSKKKSWLIPVIVIGAIAGVLCLGAFFYFCCAAGECACATCAACCCLCCSKRKKTSGGQVYQTLPEQGNNSTIPQSTYTPNTMSYSYNAPVYPSSDAPYDPPQPAAFNASSNATPYEKYDTNTAVANAASGHGEAASYYNPPELKYDYQPPSYPPTSH